ncbi:kinase-like protein [Periconia macrospinosa]|uniref:Kinase-like protein n=1 Tax=Periconia macrospinosa TaxID=97972 RepID=A0A2V1D4G7_9PLEO|nr:kinase-like protein [Periconia macrospinosa]
MVSTILGKSGRQYLPGEIFAARPDRRKVLKASSGNESYVLKYLRDQEKFKHFQSIAADVGESRFLRMPVDVNEQEAILVYPYFKDTLLEFVKTQPDLPADASKKILRCVAEAIQELHSKGWIHLDIKPDNIIVNWIRDENEQIVVTDVVLGDFENAWKLENGVTNYYRGSVGNVIWRSLEMQTGQLVYSASDIYAYGLVCIYVYGGGDFLIPERDHFLHPGIVPEQIMVIRHLSFFGPSVPQEFISKVYNEKWCKALQTASKLAETIIKDDPGRSFNYWGEGLGKSLHQLVSTMTNLNPLARPTIDEVLAHPWWLEED